MNIMGEKDSKIYIESPSGMIRAETDPAKAAELLKYPGSSGVPKAEGEAVFKQKEEVISALEEANSG